MRIIIETFKDKLEVRSSSYVDRYLREIPKEFRRYSPVRRGWILEPTDDVWDRIKRIDGNIELTAKAKRLVRGLDRPEPPKNNPEEIEVKEFKTKPYKHQIEALRRSAAAEVYALLMEAGTGKTKVLIDTITWWYRNRGITDVIVIPPNQVKWQWGEEILTHSPLSPRIRVWSSSDFVTVNKGSDLNWHIINVEAFSSTRHLQLFAKLTGPKTFMIVDESQKIKGHTAKRTKAITKLGRSCAARRIATGTPITNNPLDLYGQFNFLDPKVLGFRSFTAFRARYAQLALRVFGNRTVQQVTGFRNLNELYQRIEPFSYRVLKRDCVDLPPRVYERLDIEPTPEQKQLLRQLRNQARVELPNGATLTVDHRARALTLLNHAAAISGGFTRPDDEEPQQLERNPKMDALRDWVEEHRPDKLVIWARYVCEVEAIAEMCRGIGLSAEALYGAVPDKQRQEIRNRFQDGDLNVLVGQTSVGTGLNLSAASTMIFYSNSFNLGDRIQCEERLDRVDELTRERLRRGESTLIIDFCVRGMIDERLILALAQKQLTADAVLRDGVTWLRGD